MTKLTFEVTYEIEREALDGYIEDLGDAEWINKDDFIRDLIKTNIIQPKLIDLTKIDWEI
jgi:hypothetical protein